LQKLHRYRIHGEAYVSGGNENSPADSNNTVSTGARVRVGVGIIRRRKRGGGGENNKWKCKKCSYRGQRIGALRVHKKVTTGYLLS
jgi:hypothetical protein